MENKYYTPSIEEFHIGFEFESNYILFEELSMNNDWTKIKLSDRHNWFYDSYVNDAVPNEFRVKYLDREDIESLGFKHDGSLWFSKGDYKVRKWIDNGLDVYDFKYKLDGEDVLEYRIFSGTIKNKSELKRLLKQLNIDGV